MCLNFTLTGSFAQKTFNFTRKHLHNALCTLKNLNLWKLNQSSDCQFYLLPKTLHYVVADCKVYLKQGGYTWCHNYVLNLLATTLKVVEVLLLMLTFPAHSYSGGAGGYHTPR